ncbi:MAG: hypothetical protein F4Y47_00370 [Acidobacteriia bacterium]|nr:hypothetical protein [Terriglobia bacterium]MYG04385.1 hypothetical protein [Terriglobia bacterium]MYK11247.1 hypothetical protein [Terriglobia bacterium]
MQLEPSELGSRIRSLLAPAGATLRSMPLVPGAPADSPQLDELRQLRPEDLFEGVAIKDRDFAKCVQSGLYLYFSALDESHRISQGIPSASGSYWHGIMHRQEGDWSNAKYWFRRVGTHPVFGQLEAQSGSPWDPYAFVDRCSEASGRASDAADLIDLQMREWRLLMRYCHRNATGI